VKTKNGFFIRRVEQFIIYGMGPDAVKDGFRLD